MRSFLVGSESIKTRNAFLACAAALASLIGVPSGVASADPEGRFNAYQTTQGCIFYNYEYGPPETGWWTISWSGNCSRGQPISGSGVLTWRSEYENYGTTVYEGRHTGTMAGGVWEGEVRKESLESEDGGPWLGAWRCGDGGGSRCHPDFYTYSAGCAAKYRYKHRNEPYEEITFTTKCPPPPGQVSGSPKADPSGATPKPIEAPRAGDRAPAATNSGGTDYDSNYVPYATSDALVPVPSNTGCISAKYVRHSLGSHYFEVSSTCSTPVFYGLGPAGYIEKLRAASQSERQAMNYDNALFTGTINSGETREERHDEVENDTVGQLRTPKTVLFACKTEKWASQEVGISLSRVYFDPDMGGCMGVPNVKKPSPGTGN